MVKFPLLIEVACGISDDPIWAIRTCGSHGCPILSDQFGFGGGAQGTMGTPKHAP